MQMSRLNALVTGWPSWFNLVADCLVLTAASYFGCQTEGGGWTLREVMIVAALALVAWLLAARVLRPYDALRKQGAIGELVETSVFVAGVAIELALLRAVLPGWLLPHLAIGHFLFVAWPAALFFRMTALTFRSLREDEAKEVLVVGAGALGRVTGEDLLADRSAPKTLVGYLRFASDPERPNLPGTILGAASDIETVLTEHPVAEVYIAGNLVKNAAAMQAVIQSCERFGVPFALPASGFRFGRARPANAKAVRDGYIHYQSVEPKPVQVALKRALDISLCAVALWLLSPLLLVTALAVKLTSRGPVLFRQQRVGMHGRPFYMLKFRSMVQNAEELKAKLMAGNEQTGPVFKMKRDPRVTGVGRFIRKYSIDELPQLINVLRGEMSIVGPRPPIPKEVAQYEPWQRRRLSVRPGLTCVWQVSGRSEISFEEWMYLDMQYIDTWSLGQDVGLILKTVPVVLTGRGAS